MLCCIYPTPILNYIQHNIKRLLLFIYLFTYSFLNHFRELIIPIILNMWNNNINNTNVTHI